MKNIKITLIAVFAFAGMVFVPQVNGQEDLESFARDFHDGYLEKLENNENMTKEDLYQALGEVNSVEEVPNSDESLQLHNFYFEDERFELNIDAFLNIETDNVEHILMSLLDSEEEYQDAEFYEETFSDVVEEVRALYDEEDSMSKDDFLEAFGQNGQTQWSGPYEILGYNVNKELSYSAFIRQDQIRGLSMINHDPDLLNRDFDVTSAQLNQLSHTTGVTYEQMRTDFGPYNRVFYDLDLDIISYYWLSDTNEDFSTISYSSDFREIMLDISYY